MPTFLGADTGAEAQQEAEPSHMSDYFAEYQAYGSSNSLEKSWVDKLDIYFQLNQMSETEAIKVATLHLDGEA